MMLKVGVYCSLSYQNIFTEFGIPKTCSLLFITFHHIPVYSKLNSRQNCWPWIASFSISHYLKKDETIIHHLLISCKVKVYPKVETQL